MFGHDSSAVESIVSHCLYVLSMPRTPSLIPTQLWRGVSESILLTADHTLRTRSEGAWQKMTQSPPLGEQGCKAAQLGTSSKPG